MSVDIGKFVRIVFRDNSIIQGTVEKWDKEESIIFNKEKDSKYIIYNLPDSVKLVQIDKASEIEADHPHVVPQTQRNGPAETVEVTDDIRNTAQALADRLRGQRAKETGRHEPALMNAEQRAARRAQLRAKKIAELKIEEAKLEREALKKRLHRTTADLNTDPDYRTPDFRKK